MQIEEQDLKFHFIFPAQTQPEWAAKVERWYQLDSPSFGLCDFYFQCLRGNKKPDLIILASSQGSVGTDRAFTQTGALSPAKFVHTLPSVRASSLCQVMEWSGPVLCIQNGISSFNTAVEEARMFLQRANTQTNPAASPIVWVLAVDSNETQNWILGKVLRALHYETESINLAR